MPATATKPKASSTTLTISKAELLSAVTAASKAVPSRSPKPILQNLRIGDGLVTGTDLEVRIDVQIAENCEPFLVPADRLASILRESRGEEVTLTKKGTSVTVRCGRGSWTLPTEDVLEYPTWDVGQLEAVCRLPADQFHRAAKGTVYATDSDSSRYALGAVLLEVQGGNPTWVATDGRRLACVETETDQAVDDRQVLVPARVMQIVMGMAHGDGGIQVETNGKDVVFTADSATVTGRMVEGRYPRWRDVIGDISGEATVLEVNDLLAAVRAAAIVTSEQSKGVTLTWTASSVVILGSSSEYGESVVTCDLVSAGKTSNTKLDPVFLADFLKGLPADGEPQVDVYAADPQSRVLLKCGDYTGVIMPLAAE